MQPGADEGVAAGPFNTAVKGGLYSIPGSSAECSYGCWVPETLRHKYHTNSSGNTEPAAVAVRVEAVCNSASYVCVCLMC